MEDKTPNQEEKYPETEYERIQCSECREFKKVEKGTWALDKGMCEPCYCIYNGDKVVREMPNDTPNQDENQPDTEYETIQCSECDQLKRVEKGTWALDNGMCEPCYCMYNGG